jgi:hypothetical protein
MFERQSLQQIFLKHLSEYSAGCTLHPREQRAAYCISNCYGPAMGAHALTCPNGDFQRLQYHACRHRSCPRCTQPAQRQKLDGLLDRLLPCPHFHVVFTLPHEFLALWERNRRRMAQALFDCARESLLSLLADPRHLGATPALMMSLHTWGRTLSRHPHVHALVSAGGVDASGEWRSTRGNFLVPVAPLQKLFRGKFLGWLGAALHARSLALPDDLARDHWRAVVRQQYREHWNIQISEPYAHGRGVALYLARYARGGPLPAKRTLLCDAHRVRFGYHDHRSGEHKTAELQVAQFISRVLWHAPPQASHTTRYAGLYASALKPRLLQARNQLAQPDRPRTWPRPAATTQAAPEPRCPHCQTPLARRTIARVPYYRAHQSGGFSIAAASGQHTRPDSRADPLPPPSRAGPTGRSNGHLMAGRISRSTHHAPDAASH